MDIPQHDRPRVELSLNTNNNELTITWGPDAGPWGIYSEKSTPATVKIKEWELYVGTKADANQLDDPDEPGEYKIFHGTVNALTKMTILLNDKDYEEAFGEAKARGYILARVIGYFDSQNERGEPIVEGIYSDVVRRVIPKAPSYSIS
jgi:hypothetical protein